MVEGARRAAPVAAGRAGGDIGNEAELAASTVGGAPAHPVRRDSSTLGSTASEGRVRRPGDAGSSAGRAKGPSARSRRSGLQRRPNGASAVRRRHACCKPGIRWMHTGELARGTGTRAGPPSTPPPARSESPRRVINVMASRPSSSAASGQCRLAERASDQLDRRVLVGWRRRRSRQRKNPRRPRTAPQRALAKFLDEQKSWLP